MTPVTIGFTPDADEIGRLQADFLKLRDNRTLPMSMAVGLAALFVLQGVLNLLWRHGVLVLGCMQIVLGLMYVPLMFQFRLLNRFCVKPSVPIEITIDDAGVAIAEPPTRIPWKRVSKVQDVGEAFLILRRFAKSVPILKRALPDGGRALWAALDTRLTAPRYLVRGSDSRLTISNSAIRDERSERST